MKAQRKEADFSRGRRGAVLPPAKGKTRITIRLDTNVLDWFRQEVNRAGGGNYQTLMNEALRQHVETKRENLEVVDPAATPSPAPSGPELRVEMTVKIREAAPAP